jgi:non-ribosomal peptide synthetase component F
MEVNAALESSNVKQVDVYPCTPLQEAMVTKTLKNPEAYTHQVCFKSKTNLDHDMLTLAFRNLARKHDILRTRFVSTSEGFHQVVHDNIEGIVVVEVESDLDGFLLEDYNRGIDLSGPSMARLTLVRGGDEESAILTIHHAVYDGWSLSLIMEDLMAAYEGQQLEAGVPFRLFIDHTKSVDQKEVQSYWSAYLKGVEAQESLTLGPCENPDNLHTATLDETISMSLIEASAKAADVTSAVVLKFAWALTLRKYTRQSDVLFGQVLASRDIPLEEAESLVGPTINTVPCRVHVDDEQSIIDSLKGLQRDHGKMLPNSHIGLSEIQKLAGIMGDQWLFNSLFVYEKLPPASAASRDEKILSYTHVPASNPSSESGLFELVLFPENNELRVTCTFDGSKLGPMQSVEILQEFAFTLQSLIHSTHNSGYPDSLWELSKTQLDTIDSHGMGPVVPLHYSLVHQSFENVAVRLPNAPAIEMEGTQLTYSELDHATYNLAKSLVTSGVAPNSVIAVIGYSSIEFVVSVLAVARMGAILVPVDSRHPRERISYYLKDSGAVTILTNKKDANMLREFPGGPFNIIAIDTQMLSTHEMPGERITFHSPAPSDTFMQIYTSGSTGVPKGVKVPHQGMANIAVNVCPSSGMVEGARVLQSLAVGFDACAEEIWGTLSNGACLVIRGEDILETLKTVSVILQTPTFLNSYLGDPTTNPQIQSIQCGGEPCPKELKDRWSGSVNFLNSFGPTEISVMSHYAVLTPDQPVNIGRVIPNGSCYVLDQDRRKVPVGVIGELYLGGIGVANGNYSTILNLFVLFAQCYLPTIFVFF